jgi:hypothetical protein
MSAAMKSLVELLRLEQELLHEAECEGISSGEKGKWIQEIESIKVTMRILDEHEERRAAVLALGGLYEA